MAHVDSWAEVIAALEGYADEVLETDDVSVEYLIPEVWVPPTHSGALPETLVERATALLLAQKDALQHLDTLHSATGRHLAAVRSVPSERDDAQSVYLDVVA
ncbi:MAG: hypothetical protein JWM51_693 [Microbacteriaceae bacterium]|jgi:hypothetical protein|nr:hypothetical protein [Microbacteriaceae bacterium]